VPELWEGDAFPLGAGQGRLDEVLGSLRARGYEGWIVVEQDVLPRRHGRRSAVITRTGADPFGRFVHAALRERGVDDAFVSAVAGLPTPVTFCEIFGAGDGFGGALCHGLLAGWPLERVLRFAKAAGSSARRPCRRRPRLKRCWPRWTMDDAMPTNNLHRPSGSLAAGRRSVDLDQTTVGWTWSSLRVLTLRPGDSQRLETGPPEMLVPPLAGSCAVTCAGEQMELAGRPSVFDGVTDFAYLPRGTAAEVSSEAGRWFALPGALAGNDLPFRYAAAADVAVELRGAGSCSRQVNNFCTQDAFEADRLLACEVLTPAGNWSSYRRTSTTRRGRGSRCSRRSTTSRSAKVLMVSARPAGPALSAVLTGPGGAGLGYQRVYGTASRPVDVLAGVRSGDLVLVPHGWHGPSMAAPGYDMYYLNVMAGPGERRRLICDVASIGARSADGPVLISIETDPMIGVPDSQSWWDVPVAEVSELDSVNQARAAYEAALPRQRRYL